MNIDRIKSGFLTCTAVLLACIPVASASSFYECSGVAEVQKIYEDPLTEKTAIDFRVVYVNEEQLYEGCLPLMNKEIDGHLLTLVQSFEETERVNFVYKYYTGMGPNGVVENEDWAVFEK